MDIVKTGFVTNTNVSYSIDGVPRGTAVRNAENRDSYIYDQSLFNVTGLTNGEHTLWVGLSSPSVLIVWYYFRSSMKPLTCLSFLVSLITSCTRVKARILREF